MQAKLALSAWLLCCTTSSCYAVEWSTIIEKKEYLIQVDIDSYKVEDLLPTMTVKTVYQSSQSLLAQHDRAIAYTSSIKRMQFNCEQPYYRIKTKQLFSETDLPVLADMKATAFKKIETGTDMFSIGQLTCQVHSMLSGYGQ